MKISKAILAVSLVTVGCCYAQDYLLFPKGSPPAKTIDVIDLRNTSDDTKLAAITLLGHVNSGSNAKACAWLRDTEVTSDMFWIDWIKTKHYIEEAKIISIEKFFSKYDHSYTSVIVYDPNLPATINIATMIASVENGIAIAPADIEKYRGKRKLTDLRGRWTKNVDTYEWAYTNLWPQMNHNILCSYHPTANSHYLRDYLVRNKIFTFWITGKNAEDKLHSDFEIEKQFAQKIFAATPPNIPLVGWLSTGTDEGITEYAGVGFAGQYGKIIVGSDWGSSLSFYSGIVIDVNKVVDKYASKKRPQTPALDPKKVYLSFVIVESGDSPIYWQAVEQVVWSDKKRGQVPIEWSLGPPAFEMLGPIIEWFYDNATDNDYFFLAPSGNGYVHPYRDFMSKTTNPSRSWDIYLATLQKYVDTLKLHELSLYTDAWKPFDRAKNDLVTLRFTALNGIDMLIMGMGRDENALQIGPNYTLGSRNVIVSHVVTRWDPKNVGRNTQNNTWLAAEIRKNTPSQRPAFIVIHPLSWSYHPSDLVEVIKQLGNDYVPVSLPAFYDLYKKASQ